MIYKDVDCYLVFFDFSKIQGWSGKLVKLLGLSHITHVAPVFVSREIDSECITICEGRESWYHRKIVPNSKVHSLEKLQHMGAEIKYQVWLGKCDIDYDKVLMYASQYTDASSWDLVFHHFVGRFLGLTRPRMCTTFVAGLFKDVPEIWHPANLARYYRKKHNDNTVSVWSGKGGQDNNVYNYPFLGQEDGFQSSDSAICSGSEGDGGSSGSD